MLNINYVKPTPRPAEARKYLSPKGLWEVTTEDDEEGRSTKNLGIWHGHIAEIAFHLAHECFYTLQFRDISDSSVVPFTVPDDNTTTFDNVWISLFVDSNTWGMTPEDRAKFIANLLDSDEQLDVHGRYGGCQYYAGACLVLKNK
jgi:hypothetical protein